MARAEFDDFEGTVTITDWNEYDTEQVEAGKNSAVFEGRHGYGIEFIWLDADSAMALEEAGLLELSGPSPTGVFESVQHEGYDFFLYKAV